jgi:pimeloyl-ACP methyl ester carboxylesterase
MIPLYFNGCFGRLHPARGTRGVVLCSPLGGDALRTHRAWLQLGEHLAGAGLPTLRFDYPDAGDSLGAGGAAAGVEAWLASIEAAVACLRRETGVSEVVLIGFRFGATLALAAAERLGGVEGVGLLAPSLSGRAFRRELAMLARLGRKGETAEGLLEADGLALTEDTVRGLDGLEVLKADARPAERALVLWREGAPGDARFSERLRALGTTVQEGELEGYAKLVFPAEFSRYPDGAFAHVVEWAARGADAGAAAPGPLRVWTPRAEAAGDGFRETVTTLGDAGLWGVLCEPLVRPAAERPVLMFLNIAALQRAGPGGMWAWMARQFARQGFTSLRFDLPGLGDSPAPEDGRPRLEHIDAAVADAKAVLDWLQAQGWAEAATIALCWGGQVACNLALADPRVSAQALINPRRHFWSVEVPHHRVRTPLGYLKKALDPAAWRRLWTGAVKLSVARDAARRVVQGLASKFLTRLFGAETEEARAAKRIRSLAARGVSTLLLYGETDVRLGELEDFMGAGRDDLGRLLDVEFCVMGGVGDHLFALQSERDRLLGRLGEHLLALEPVARENRPPVSRRPARP